MNHLKVALTSALFLSTLPAYSISCRSRLAESGKRSVRFIHEHDSKSAVDHLGLGSLRNSQDPEVQAWVKSHNERTTAFLSQGKDGKADGLDKTILERAKEIFPQNAPPVVELGENSILTKGGNLVIKNSRGEETVLVAKVAHGENLGATVVSEFKVSPDAKYVAYAQVKNGLDVNQWSVMEIATRKVLVSNLDVRMIDFNWSVNSDGVYYTKWASVDEALDGVKYAHNYYVNLKTGESKLVFVPPAKDNMEFYGIETFNNAKNETQLVAYRTQGVAEVPNALYIGSKGTADTSKGEFQVGEYKWSALEIPKKDNLGRLVGIKNGQIIVRTSEVGNTFGLLTIDPVTRKTKTLVPASKNEVLLFAQLFGDKLYLQYLEQSQFHSVIKVADLNGQILKSFKMSDIEKTIPNTGTLTLLAGHNSSENLYFTYGDVAQPSMTLKINQKTLAVEKLASPDVNFDVSKIQYSLNEAISKDGTPVTYKTWVRTDIQKPKVIYLYYYGFIGIAQLGMYNKKFQGQLDLGGAVSIVTERGSGDKGRDFQMGVKADRFPSMEDIVAAAKELRKKYPGVPIIASGRSFGGLMTLMLAVHYPEYFDGFSSVVPVSDVNEGLNRGLFGRFMGDDFAIPRNSQTGEHFDTAEWRDLLNKWSPLWNLKKLDPKNIKPIIIFSGANDERVGPEQARFFIQAFLNRFPEFAGKIHYYEEPNNGHVGRAEFAQESAFIARLIGLTPEEYKPLKK